MAEPTSNRSGRFIKPLTLEEMEELKTYFPEDDKMVEPTSNDSVRVKSFIQEEKFTDEDRLFTSAEVKSLEKYVRQGNHQVREAGNIAFKKMTQEEEAFVCYQTNSSINTLMRRIDLNEKKVTKPTGSP